MKEWYLETKIWVLGVLIAIEMSFFFDSQQTELDTLLYMISIYTHGIYIYVHIYIYIVPVSIHLYIYVRYEASVFIYTTHQTLVP